MSMNPTSPESGFEAFSSALATTTPNQPDSNGPFSSSATTLSATPSVAPVLKPDLVSVSGMDEATAKCSNFPCIVVLPDRRLSEPKTITFPPFTQTLIVVNGGLTATTMSEVETVTGGSITKVLVTLLTVQDCSTSTTSIIVSPSLVVVEQLPSCSLFLQSSSGSAPPYPCIHPASTTLMIPNNMHPIPWHGYNASTTLSGPDLFNPCVYESKTEISIMPTDEPRQRCPPQCLSQDWCSPFCDADTLPIEMPSQCKELGWCMLFWKQRTGHSAHPDPDPDDDPECV